MSGDDAARAGEPPRDEAAAEQRPRHVYVPPPGPNFGHWLNETEIWTDRSGVVHQISEMDSGSRGTSSAICAGMRGNCVTSLLAKPGFDRATRARVALAYEFGRPPTIAVPCVRRRSDALGPTSA